MAKIVTGGGVAAISGKIGGTVFASNKGGAYMRAFKVPTNPKTTYQEDARDSLAQYSNEWRTLTDGQRESWAAWAAAHPVVDRLGASRLLTGSQAYVKINANRDLAGDATANATVPGDPAFVQSIVDVSAPLVADVSDAFIGIPLTAAAVAGQVLFVYVTPALSAGINASFGQERLLPAVTLDAGMVTNLQIEIDVEWIARFGTLTGQAGKKLSAHVYQCLEGQTGSAMAVSGIIAA